MAKLNVPPTKSTYIDLKRQLDFAKEGYDLLEQKREILVIELMRYVDRSKVAQKEVNEKMEAAFVALRDAQVRQGSLGMTRESAGVSYDHQLQVSEHRLMGLRVPVVEAETAALKLQFSPGDGSACSDEAMSRFLDALASIAKLAQIETTVWRLAREVKKTQRRVNALEKIFIPDYTETLDYINSSLEEKEREAFFMMKMVKRRAETP